MAAHLSVTLEDYLMNDCPFSGFYRACKFSVSRLVINMQVYLLQIFGIIQLLHCKVLDQFSFKFDDFEDFQDPLKNVGN